MVNNDVKSTLTRLSYRFEQGAAWITLSDAERGNSIDLDVALELLGALRQAEIDGARVVVLGSLGRFFSVGGDLESFAAASNIGQYIDDLAEALHRVISELMRSEAVVISVVQGPAAGAGFSLAAAADIVVAAESASFTFAYTAVGLSNDGGSSLLVHTLGLHRVLRMALLNDRCSAQEALHAGLVARVVAEADLAALVDKMVSDLLSGSASAASRVKRLIRETVDQAPEAVMRRETLAIRRSAEDDGREGVRAFLDKRPPRFTPPAHVRRDDGKE